MDPSEVTVISGIHAHILCVMAFVCAIAFVASFGFAIFAFSEWSDRKLSQKSPM